MKFVFVKVILVLLSVGESAILRPPDQLRCVKTAEAAGLCIADVPPDSNCCQSFAGDECRKELNQFDHYASPTLTFFQNSLILDTRLKVLCVEGLQVSDKEGLKDREIRGVYMELSIFQRNQVQPYHFISTTFVFNGHMTSQALKGSLLCLDLNVGQIFSGESNFVTLSMSPLPPNDKVELVPYSSMVPVCNLTRGEIFHKACREWWQEATLDYAHCQVKAPNNSENVSTKSPTPPKPTVLEAPTVNVYFDPRLFWVVVSMAVLLFLILLVAVVAAATLVFRCIEAAKGETKVRSGVIPEDETFTTGENPLGVEETPLLEPGKVPAEVTVKECREDQRKEMIELESMKEQN